MPDRETVFDAIRNCITEPKCRDCPWDECDKFDCKRVDVPVSLMLDVLKLLKEQEPKKIIRKQAIRNWDDGSVEYFAEWYCPHCKSLLVRGFENKWIEFCPKCGKPISWEGR